MAAIYQFHFLFVLSHILILLAIFHTRNSFSAICVLISWYNFLYFDEPSYWKCTLKENGSRNWCNTTLPIKCFTQSPFLKSFCILTSLNVEIQDYRPLPFPLFSDLSNPIHCFCWNLHHKLVSSNTCWFYMALLHTLPQGSPRKVESTNFCK